MRRPKYVMCVKGDFDLTPWKVYRTLSDAKGLAHGLLRVVDDSGEDYLYPQSCFLAVKMPEAVEKLLPRRRTAKNPPSRSRRRSY